MTTDSQGFSGGVSNIPTTAAALEQFIETHKAEWPPELQDCARGAYLALARIGMNSPYNNQMTEQYAPKAWQADLNAIVKFAEAYGRWQEFRKR